MKLFLKDEILRMPNPTPEKAFGKAVIAGCPEGCNDSACALLILPPNGEVPLHYHKTREIWLFMVDGQIEQTVDGKTYTLKSGDTMFIAPGEVHGVKNAGPAEARFVEAWTTPAVEPDFYLP